MRLLLPAVRVLGLALTADGQRNVVDGVEPTNHAEHETIEITQGIWGDPQSCQAREDG